jgi:hypothetical protein
LKAKVEKVIEGMLRNVKIQTDGSLDKWSEGKIKAELRLLV